MKRTVFISHSSKDKAIGDEVCRFLEANGVLCWIAPRDVTPGKNYGAAILDAIDECKVFVLILSRFSNKSGQVVREVERAASTNSIIIPFRVEDVQPSRDLEFYVSSAHWLDAITRPLEKHLRELLKAIKDWQQGGVAQEDRSAPSVPPPPPVPLAPKWSPVWLGGAAAGGIAVILCGVAAYKVLRHPTRRPLPSSKLFLTLTPMPSASVALNLETAAPSPTASVALNAATSLPTTPPLPTASLPRRRPGEPIRLPVESTSASISPALTSPGPVRPGEPPAPASAPIVREIAASSQHDNHGAYLAFDGNQTTAWVTDTDGVGQSISVNFKSPETITSVSILNGNGKDVEHYRANNRVRTLRLKWSDGSTQVISFEDKMKMQHFQLQHRAATEWIKFEILSVYPGARNNWAAISEIAFNKD